MSAEEPTRAQEEREEKGKKPKKIKVSGEEYQKLLEKAKELEESRDRLLRQAAEFENAKKRLLKEKTEFLRFANQGILQGLLPIVDNLERAIAHAGDAAGDKQSSFREGIHLIRKQLMAVLLEFGMKKIEALGKSFDPHFHEAVAWVETGEAPENTILEEVVSGYLLHGRVLRAAKVKVAKARSEGAPGSPRNEQGFQPSGETEARGESPREEKRGWDSDS